VVSKPSIGFKVKAERGVQPLEYIEYFEDWTPRANTKSSDLDSRGGFETTAIVTVATDANTCRILFTPLYFFLFTMSASGVYKKDHRRCILLKTKEFFSLCDNIHFLPDMALYLLIFKAHITSQTERRSIF
jgi:hypothetical protein